MERYHKINALFKRHMSGPKKGKLMIGDWALPEFAYLAKCPWLFREKVDGTNIRVGFNHLYTGAGSHWRKEVEFGGRTEAADIPPALLEHLENTFTTGLFRDAFPDLGDAPVTLFGEGYGPKIQGGGKYRNDHSFVLFDVKIGDWWLLQKDVEDIAVKLGIDSVPILGEGTIQDAIDIVSLGFRFTETGGTEYFGRKMLQSAWGNFEAEGIVAVPSIPLFTRRGDRIITKIKAVDFK